MKANMKKAVAESKRFAELLWKKKTEFENNCRQIVCGFDFIKHFYTNCNDFFPTFIWAYSFVQILYLFGHFTNGQIGYLFSQ